MTITRIAEAHAEASDRELLVWGDRKFTRSNVQAHTGVYSFDQAANGSPMVLPAYDATALICQLYMWNDHTGWGGDVSVIAFKETLTASLGVEFRMMDDEQTMRLYVDGSLEDEDSWANIGYVGAAWQRFCLVASSTQNYASLYFDDQKVLTYSGAIADVPWDLAFIAKRLQTQGVPSDTFFDDIYLASMTTDADALPPAYRYLPSYADGVGDHADFTPLVAVDNYEMVDDGFQDDEDTTYNYVISSGGDPKDSFETSDIVLPLDFTIVSAIPWAICRKLDAAADAKIILTSFDGSLPLKESTPAQVTHLDYFYHRARFETDADGDPWNETSFNADQFGYKAGGTF